MIKTFSISALFFMTIGVLLATHMTLPFYDAYRPGGTPRPRPHQFDKSLDVKHMA